MVAPLHYVNVSELAGSWPVLPNFLPSGAPTFLPDTVLAKATILGVQKETSAGYDVGTKSLHLYVDDEVTPVTVTFSGAGARTLDQVISDINTQVGSTVAYRDNGFLLLESPTSGDGSYLRVASPAIVSDVLYVLGLFPDTISRAGHLNPARHPDPIRQVSLPGQLTLSEGEGFSTKALNRALFQLGVNADRSEALLSRKRVASKNEVALHTYVAPAEPGYQFSGDTFVYTGSATTPTSAELEKLFVVLDSDGREFTKEYQNVISTLDMYFDRDDEDNQRAWSLTGGLAGGKEKQDMYIVCDDGSMPAALQGVPMKIINYIYATRVQIAPIDPATGDVVKFTLGDAGSPVTGKVVQITTTKCVIEEVRKTATSGSGRVEGLEETRYSATLGSSDRVDLNNRLTIPSAGFNSLSPAIEPGDILEWTNHAVTSPFSNNGTYRVSAVVDDETLELVGEDWGPVHLNPDLYSNTPGDVLVRTDGSFWKDPFIAFKAAPNGAIPEASDDISILYLGATTIREASDDPTAFGLGLEFDQEADETLQRAILAMMGPSVETIDEYLYGDRRKNLEDLDFRLNVEHYNHDEAHPVYQTQREQTGKHRDIRPDNIDMFHETAGQTVTVRSQTGESDNQVKIGLLDGGADQVFEVTANGYVYVRNPTYLTDRYSQIANGWIYVRSLNSSGNATIHAVTTGSGFARIKAESVDNHSYILAAASGTGDGRGSFAANGTGDARVTVKSVSGSVDYLAESTSGDIGHSSDTSGAITHTATSTGAGNVSFTAAADSGDASFTATSTSGAAASYTATATGGAASFTASGVSAAHSATATAGNASYDAVASADTSFSGTSDTGTSSLVLSVTTSGDTYVTADTLSGAAYMEATTTSGAAHLRVESGAGTAYGLFQAVDADSYVTVDSTTTGDADLNAFADAGDASVTARSVSGNAVGYVRADAAGGGNSGITSSSAAGEASVSALTGTNGNAYLRANAVTGPASCRLVSTSGGAYLRVQTTTSAVYIDIDTDNGDAYITTNTLSGSAYQVTETASGVAYGTVKSSDGTSTLNVLSNEGTATLNVKVESGTGNSNDVTIDAEANSGTQSRAILRLASTHDAASEDVADLNFGQVIKFISDINSDEFTSPPQFDIGTKFGVADSRVMAFDWIEDGSGSYSGYKALRLSSAGPVAIGSNVLDSATNWANFQLFGEDGEPRIYTVGGQTIGPHFLLRAGDSESGYVYQGSASDINSSTNAAFYSAFPFADTASVNDDGTWMAFKHMSEATLIDRFGVNKYGQVFCGLDANNQISDFTAIANEQFQDSIGLWCRRHLLVGEMPTGGSWDGFYQTSGLLYGGTNLWMVGGPNRPESPFVIAQGAAQHTRMYQGVNCFYGHGTGVDGWRYVDNVDFAMRMRTYSGGAPAFGSDGVTQWSAAPARSTGSSGELINDTDWIHGMLWQHRDGFFTFGLPGDTPDSLVYLHQDTSEDCTLKLHQEGTGACNIFLDCSDSTTDPKITIRSVATSYTLGVNNSINRFQISPTFQLSETDGYFMMGSGRSSINIAPNSNWDLLIGFTAGGSGSLKVNGDANFVTDVGCGGKFRANDANGYEFGNYSAAANKQFVTYTSPAFFEASSSVPTGSSVRGYHAVTRSGMVLRVSNTGTDGSAYLTAPLMMPQAGAASANLVGVVVKIDQLVWGTGNYTTLHWEGQLYRRPWDGSTSTVIASATSGTSSGSGDNPVTITWSSLGHSLVATRLYYVRIWCEGSDNTLAQSALGTNYAEILGVQATWEASGLTAQANF